MNVDKKYKEGLKELGTEVAKEVLAKGVKATGDAMERSKRPFIRKVVRFFRKVLGRSQ